MRLLAGTLLGDVERIAARGAERIRVELPAYRRVPHQELSAGVLAHVRGVLEAIADPGAEGGEEDDRRVAGEVSARLGIRIEDFLRAWQITLAVLREEASVLASMRWMGPEVLLEFVEAALGWSDLVMPVSAAALREAELGTVHGEFRRLTEEQAALRRVATTVARGAPSEEVFALVAEQVAGVLRVPLVAIASYDAGPTATPCGGFPRLPQTSPGGPRWSLEGGGSALSEVRRNGRPARIDDYRALPEDIAEAARQAGVGCTVGAPIIVAGRLWGAILVACTAPESLPADTEARLAAFTELVATAIANGEARRQVQRLADEQAALGRVAKLVARNALSQELFDSVAAEVGGLVGGDFASLFRYEDDASAAGVALWALAGEHPPFPAVWSIKAGSLSARVFETRQPVRVESWRAIRRPVAVLVRDQWGVSSSVAIPILVAGRLWGGLGVHSKQEQPLPTDTELRMRNFAELLATAIANTETRTEVTRLARERAALRRVATMVAHNASQEEVFMKVAQELRFLLGVETAVVQRFEPAEEAIMVRSWGKVGDEFRVGRREGIGEDGVTKLVYETQRPVRIDADERSPTRRALGLRSMVGGPIFVDGRLWGVLAAGTRRAEPMVADAEARIAQFGELVATAIANVQARADLSASRARVIATADDERRRMVRDLHDGAQQRLVHTVVTLKLARRALERDPSDAASLLGEALRQARTATNELRDLAHGILPSVLTHAGLRAAAHALASRMSIPVEIDVAVDRLPEAVEATAYFIVAEALTNVAKHARARRAIVTARLQDDTLLLEIHDDGIGGARADGQGLVGLSDRLAVVNGSLRVYSPPDCGTVLAATVPLV
jgi:signal transduction histidine kinase